MPAADPADPSTSLGDADQPEGRPVVVSARALRCRYGSFEAVRGIDLTVYRGELFALLGTNGAGKTTTLETLEGHRPADDGEVEVLDLRPHDSGSQLAARVGVMFQHSGLPADLTPVEMLEVWAQLTPGSPRHLGAEEALARVDLEHRADVRIRQLSGGERRRLDLAIAVLNRPELVFLDEPTTGMDPEARVRTWQIIRDLLAEDTTILLTTHYLEEAEALADRLAIMHRGRIATSGTLGEVIGTQPANIHARLPSDHPSLPPLDGEANLQAGGRLTVETRRLQSDLTRLLDWAQEHRLTLEGLRASEASLDQVFHDIAGARPLGEGNIELESS